MSSNSIVASRAVDADDRAPVAVPPAPLQARHARELEAVVQPVALGPVAFDTRGEARDEDAGPALRRLRLHNHLRVRVTNIGDDHLSMIRTCVVPRAVALCFGCMVKVR